MKNLKFIFKLLVICFALLHSVSSTPQLHQATDGREYLIEREPKYNWYQAWHECARRDFQLVVIDSEAKNNAIIGLLQKVIGKSLNLWLGGNDEYSSSKDYNRSFYWSATGKQFGFTFWSENNPDNFRNQEHCVHIWGTKPQYQWNDIVCTSTMGFICETNHNLETCNKNLKTKCDAIKQSSSSISIEFDEAQKQQASEMDSKLKNIDRKVDDWKMQVQQLQNATQVQIERIINEQEKNIGQLTAKMQKEWNDLSVELKTSAADINKKFGEKLNVKQNDINKIC